MPIGRRFGVAMTDLRNVEPNIQASGCNKFDLPACLMFEVALEAPICALAETQQPKQFNPQSKANQSKFVMFYVLT